LNPEARYIVVGNKSCNKALKIILPKTSNVKYLEKFDFKETDMKFDCIVMNPPYSRNLHLKILAEAIKHLNDEKSVCVNLSPVRWLQDPLAKWKAKSDQKRFESSVLKHIDALDIISSDKSCELFSNCLNVQCGIYKCIPGISNKSFVCQNAIIDKCYANFIKNNTIEPHIKHCVPRKFACVISLICGGKQGWTEKCPPLFMMTKEKAYYNDGKNCYGQTYKEYRDKMIWGNLKPKSEVSNIEFNTIEERENFYNSCALNAFKYIYKESMVDVNVHPDFLPWLGDTINPRTGKKGYEGEWTDDDLYKLFNMTPDEIKTIEDTMKKYKQ